jgi:hypothetical protein
MSRLVRISILCTGSALFLMLIAFLVLAWRSRTADCVRNVVRFEVSAPNQSGAELVVIVVPADTYGASSIRITLNGVRSTHEVLFNPFSRENLNCSRVLQSVDFVLEKGGMTIARTSLTYPKDFHRDEKGDYIARAPVIFEH